MSGLRVRAYGWLDPSSGGRLGKVVDVGLAVLIVANVVAVVAESEESIYVRHHRAFDAFELFSIAVFTAEYLLRTWTAVEDGRFRGAIRGRLRYALTPMALVDLAAILPFYLGMFLDFDGRVLRAVRLFRVFKLTRYSGSMEILFSVLRNELPVLLSATFIMVVFIILASAGIYLVEREAQPSAFGSIPRSMWWATVTLTTVGYGDVVPVTAVGKILGVFITILGVGMAALPAGIIASGFSNELARRRGEYRMVVREALDDGDLKRGERTLLEEEREALGLSESDARLVVEDERHASMRGSRSP